MKKLQIIFLCALFGLLCPMTHLVYALVEFSLYTKLNQSEPFKDASDGNRDPSDTFIITVKTDNLGSSGDDQLRCLGSAHTMLIGGTKFPIPA